MRAGTLLAVLLVALAARAEGPDLDLSTLMGHFAASRGVEARFEEEKHLPLLREPLRSEGVLYYAPPGRMARFTTEPETTSLLLDDDRVRIEDSLGVEELDLAANPQARRFVEQLLLLFRGDREALERDYEARLEADGEDWTLTLSPRSRVVRQVMERITLRGNASRLATMQVDGAQGERTLTRYSAMRTDRPFSDAERARLFPDDGAPQPLDVTTLEDADTPVP